MKEYNYSEAVEVLIGMLQIYDKATLIKELAKASINMAFKIDNYDIKSFNIKIKKNKENFEIQLEG